MLGAGYWKLSGLVLLTLILICCVIFFWLIPQLRHQLEKAQETSCRDLTAVAWQLLDGYNSQVMRNELSLEEAQRRAIKRIRTLRFGEQDKNYFWINNTDAVMVMHPYQPELEQQNLKDYRDPQGNAVLRDVVAAAMNPQHDGIIEYEWQWKDIRTQIEHKTSHVRQYEPWGWIVGAGVYANDVNVVLSAMQRKLYAATAGILLVMVALIAWILRSAFCAEAARIDAEKQQERLSLIIESTTDLISIARPDGSLVYLNPAGYKMLKWAENALPMRRTLSDAHPVSMAEFIWQVAIPKAKKDGVWVGETAVLSATGKHIPVSQVIMCHRDEAGEAEYYSAIIRDISEARTLQHQLLDASERMEERVEERTRLLEEVNERLQIEVAERKVEKKIQQFHAEFEMLISSIMREVIYVRPTQLDQALDDAMRRVGEFLMMEHCYLALYTADHKAMKKLYRWKQEGSSQSDVPENVDLSEYSWFNQQILSGATVLYAAGIGLPEEAVQERNWLEEKHIHAVVTIPLMAGNEVVGFFGVQSVKHHQNWPGQTLTQFRVLGDVLISAILRE